MKFMSLAFFLVSISAFASTCETSLIESVQNDANIRVVKMEESYNCGASACAIVFEHDSHPYPNLKVLAFLDLKSKMKVNWVPVNGSILVGNETFKGNKLTYVMTSNVGSEKIKIDASIESNRGAIFWPPHKVYYKETFHCSK